MSADKFDWAREMRESAANTKALEIRSTHAVEIADELDARQATIDKLRGELETARQELHEAGGVARAS